MLFDGYSTHLVGVAVLVLAEKLKTYGADGLRPSVHWGDLWITPSRRRLRKQRRGGTGVAPQPQAWAPTAPPSPPRSPHRGGSARPFPPPNAISGDAAASSSLAAGSGTSAVFPPRPPSMRSLRVVRHARAMFFSDAGWEFSHSYSFASFLFGARLLKIENY